MSRAQLHRAAPRRSFSRLALERLEPRTMLKGDVTAEIDVNGNAVITGDFLANVIAINDGANPGELFVKGKDTLIDDAESETLVGFTGDLLINLQGGSNKLSLRNLNVGPGQNVFVQMGGGNDKINVVTAVFEGDFSANTGDGEERIAFKRALFEAAFSLNLGDDESQIQFNIVDFNAPATIVGGGDRDVFNFESVDVDAPLLVQTGGGLDRVNLVQVDINEQSEFNLGDGDDKVIVKQSDFMAAVTINGAAGNDYFQASFSSFSPNPTFQSVETQIFS